MESFQDSDLIYRQAHWSIIGRLTASLFHEINNPMQAVRGAMSLALEELEDAEALRIYLDLGVRESDRILNLIARVRRVFIMENSEIVLLDLNAIIREVVLLSAKEMSNKRVKISLELATTLPMLKGRYHELALAALSPLFAMSDNLAAAGGDEITVCSMVENGFALLELGAPRSYFQNGELNLPVCSYVVGTYEGWLSQVQRDGQWLVRIALPVAS